MQLLHVIQEEILNFPERLLGKILGTLLQVLLLLGLVAVVNVRQAVETGFDEFLGVHLLRLLLFLHRRWLGEIDRDLPDDLGDLSARDDIDLAVADVG